MSIFLKRDGFNLIEVIITIVILSIIATGLSSLFSVTSDTPIILNRRRAYMYAESEMEKLFNKSYDDITTISKTSYPDDGDFDYEIIVNEVETGLKSVRVNFYASGATEKIAELYSLFVKTALSVCDDFEENGDRPPPLEWNPTSGWRVVRDPTDATNHVYRYVRRNIGYTYPSSLSGSNYKEECVFFVESRSSFGVSNVYLGGRVDHETGYGYYIYVSVSIYRFWWFNIAIYYPYLIKIDSRGTHTLSYLPSSLEFLSGNYTGVHRIGLKFDGSNISCFFDSDTGSASDSEFTSGTIMLRGENQNTRIYFDDVCVEGE